MRPLEIEFSAFGSYPGEVTVDFDSLDDQAVTVRDRDTMEQVRVPIADLIATVSQRLGF